MPTEIDWTEETYNPSTGCTKVSDGCDNCYAEKIAENLQKHGRKYYRGFKYTEHGQDAIDKPLHWKKPKMIFVNSMSDLFHEKATEEFLLKVRHVMLTANQHTYQILTKRPERMRRFFDKYGTSFNHVWTGVSVENQKTTYRIDTLRKVKSNMKFISFEPLLGPINVNLDGIDWAIIGGESGKKHRPPKPEWVRDLIDLCQKSNVPTFFKQWGGLFSKSNGYTIDGKTYREYPKIPHESNQTVLS